MLKKIQFFAFCDATNFFHYSKHLSFKNLCICIFGTYVYFCKLSSDLPLKFNDISKSNGRKNLHEYMHWAPVLQ